MHYYPHHIGDFIKDTARLNDSQSMAYLRLLWKYYDEESPLTSTPEKLAFNIGASPDDVRLILEHFFTFDGNSYRHSRCDKVLEEYKRKSEKAAKSADARWNKAKAMRTHSECIANEHVSDANQKPITNNQYIEEETTSLVASKLPTCPQQSVIDAYHDKLPDLPRVRVITSSRQRAIRAFWKWVLESKKSDGTPRAETSEQALEWIGQYFERASHNDFLMGRTMKSSAHSNWKCDLDYLLTDRGRVQVIEKTQ